MEVYITGRIVEGIHIDPIDYYLNNETKEDAIEDIKSDLRETFNEWHTESVNGHNDEDYDIDEFINALDEFDWDIPLEDRDEVIEQDY